MTEIRVPYGKGIAVASLPDRLQAEIIAPREVDPAPDPIATVNHALDHPLGGKRLADFVGATSAAIAINDKTRPVPLAQLLPPLLDRLKKLGIPQDKITLVIASGVHPIMPVEQYRWILPEAIIAAHPIVCHNSDDEASLVNLGTTARNTPVFINKAYMDADLRLVVGNVEPHQFMGYSGGVKSAAIGLAGKKTINHNHAMMTQEMARLGQYDGNPMREDVEEIGRMIGVNFALNALLNGDKQIVEAFAGDPVAVMQTAVPKVQQNFQIGVTAPFDLLIVSPGGHPKDINVYQSQKALGHASLIMKPGGTVILVAACPEGTGSVGYERWILGDTIPSHQEVLERFAHEGFRVGPHKAFQISRDASRFKTFLISEMDDEFVRRLLLHPAKDLQTALDSALESLPDDARIGVIPIANATIPALRAATH
jgi:nickel-dependent lactate racemase